ncbi:hypothetical protein RvY_11449-2 [Ramazzottius varieornatus]|uniref:Uncharacterized protein n=1 Tax=Ramazzottius varieornatus TaxID=947166 RepID=A0A1D1VG57_RAMVA|nr:hypothetical protein RvY_11449-2 [Ramazzottius varieornatus]
MGLSAIFRGFRGASPLLVFLVLMFGVSVAKAGMQCGDSGLSCPSILGGITSIGASGSSSVGGDYCCRRSGNVPFCCDFDTFVSNWTGLTVAAIVGIAIGCLVAVILFFVLCCCCCGLCCFG